MKKMTPLLIVGIFLFTLALNVLAQNSDRKEVDVPKVDPSAITIDGKMDEAAWENAAHADMVSDVGFEIWANYYGRDVSDPDFDEMYGRLLWTEDTLYVFMHIDEFVDDSTNLFWQGKWAGDQLFIGLSNRLGVELLCDVGDLQYQGNVWTAPDGPYHFLVLGDQVTLNNNEETWMPDEFMHSPADTALIFDAADIARWSVFIDKEIGIWDVEMAIHNPHVKAQSAIGFNIGGSVGSDSAYAALEDAYAYYTWQPNVADEPFTNAGENDPGFHNLVNSSQWAILDFSKKYATGIKNDFDGNQPVDFQLSQNYPNPFNPTTTIRFSVNETMPVTLKVFNTLGQNVATLINGQPYSAGRYRVTWNASSLSTGVYFYKLEAGGNTITKKMLLIK